MSVKPKPPGQHGNSTAICWRYFGQLCDADGKLLDEARLYCSLCLDAEQQLGDKGHLSQVASFSSATSTGNLNCHLSNKHAMETNSEAKNKKILSFFQKSDNGCTLPAKSEYELNRDITMWFCRDLMPFEAVSMGGFTNFFAKNMAHCNLPKPQTLANTALFDIYQVVHGVVKQQLTTVNSVCLMFDGWTDRYKMRPYMGVRISFLRDWKYRVVTLGCHVLASHTAKAVAEHVSNLLSEFFSDTKKLFITSCHDGAANMVKSSKLLKVDAFQHCTAHCLHLLLTTDSINRLEEVKDLLQRCRDIVSTLHFKTLLIEDEMAATKDKVLIVKLEEQREQQQKVANIQNVLDIDEQYSPDLPQDEATHTTHAHQSLKSACPTRWNSTLYMCASLLQLKSETQNALKRSGHVDMCLGMNDIDFLEQLVAFLKPFNDFTQLFSCSMPSLSLIPIVKLQIKKNCVIRHEDDPKIKMIKEAVLAKLDHRFPETPSIKLHQLLDPETKNLIPRLEAMRVLEDALQDGKRRNLIMVETQPSTMSSASFDDGNDDAELKMKRMRMEYVSELRSSAGDCEDSGVCTFSCNFTLLVI
jgi:hypothetical protein